MEAKLIVVGGKANRSEIKLKLPAILGRGRDADLTVAHASVSRHHCKLEEVDGALVLRDNGSTNGTFVGKKRIKKVVIKPGGEFTVGPITFRAEYEYAGKATAETQLENEQEPTVTSTSDPLAFLASLSAGEEAVPEVGGKEESPLEESALASDDPSADLDAQEPAAEDIASEEEELAVGTSIAEEAAQDEPADEEPVEAAGEPELDLPEFSADEPEEAVEAQAAEEEAGEDFFAGLLNEEQAEEEPAEEQQTLDGQLGEEEDAEEVMEETAFFTPEEEQPQEDMLDFDLNVESAQDEEAESSEEEDEADTAEMFAIDVDSADNGKPAKKPPEAAKKPPEAAKKPAAPAKPAKAPAPEPKIELPSFEEEQDDAIVENKEADSEEEADFEFLNADDDASPMSAAGNDDPTIAIQHDENDEPRPAARNAKEKKPAKKGWWPFGGKKAKPAPAAKVEKKKPEPIPEPAAEEEEEEEEFVIAEPEEVEEEAPAPQAKSTKPAARAAAGDGPDFSFIEAEDKAPAESSGDDDLDNFFQDLGLK